MMLAGPPENDERDGHPIGVLAPYPRCCQRLTRRTRQRTRRLSRRVSREEILRIIAKHVDVAPEKVEVRLEHGEHVAVLEIGVEIPAAVARDAARERSSRAP
jgi:septum formation topological specificity factor MinE